MFVNVGVCACVGVCECVFVRARKLIWGRGSSMWLQNIWFNFGRSSKKINMNGLGIAVEKVERGLWDLEWKEKKEEMAISLIGNRKIVCAYMHVCLCL